MKFLLVSILLVKVCQGQVIDYSHYLDSSYSSIAKCWEPFEQVEHPPIAGLDSAFCVHYDVVYAIRHFYFSKGKCFLTAISFRDSALQGKLVSWLNNSSFELREPNVWDNGSLTVMYVEDDRYIEIPSRFYFIKNPKGKKSF